MEILLHLKHWQVFVMTFGVVLVSGISIFFIPTGFEYGLLFTRATTIVALLGNIAASAWLYVVTTELFKKIPSAESEEVETSLQTFKVCLFLLVGYQVAVNLVFPVLRYDMGAIVYLLSFVSLGISIYTHYFAAKMLAWVERKKNLGFGDFSGDFFAFLFYPIGIWFLQPRINNIFDNGETGFDPDAPLDQGVK